MTTFARIVNGLTTDICFGSTAADAVASGFAAGYPESIGATVGDWKSVPDGTEQQATVTVDGNGNVLTANNPPAPVHIAQPIALTKAQFQTLYAANSSDLSATLSNWPEA